MPGSRLPMPPRTGARPLPPAPQDDQDATPPPLPLRPAPVRAGQGFKKPPLKQNGRAMPTARNVVQQQTQPQSSDSDSDSDSSDDEVNYEQPENESPRHRPVPPPVTRHPPPPSPEPAGEIYDELEGTELAPPAGAQSNLQQEEVYDACQFEEVAVEEPEEFYTDAEEMPAPPALDDDSGLYEFEPDNESPTPPPPPPSSVPKRNLPLPPSQNQPPLPNRPGARQDSDDSQDKRPIVKKGDGVKQMEIKLEHLNMNRLKKVEVSPKSPEKVEKTYELEDQEIVNDTGSIQDRINRFKQKAEGSKPVLPLKPNFLSPVSSKSLGPPPPPPPSIVSDKTPEPPPPAKQPVAQDPLPPPPPAQPEYIEDEIYDEAMSMQQDPLHGNEWFHGKIDRKVAEQRLWSIGQDGAFLVRNSSKDDPKQPYTLVVLFKGHNFNLVVRVRDSDKKIALGSEKADELAFKTVIELIDYHKKNPVILVNKQLGQQETVLKRNPVNFGR